MNAIQTPTSSGRPRTYLPDAASHDELVDFARTLREFENYLAQNHRGAALVAPDGTHRAIPEEIFRALEQVVEALASGHGVTVAPYGTQMTTQEAADFLGISRPTLVKLLDGGEIAHEKRGRHRRVTLRDVVDYQERARVERGALLTELAREGQQTMPQLQSTPVLKRLDEG